jgi:hypothetical protein
VSDPYLRYLGGSQPFWQRLFGLRRQFSNRTAGETGDDFLVNYIGHPLEGSVSEIFLFRMIARTLRAVRQAVFRLLEEPG